MSIMIKPIITEKATADSEMNNRYTFLVDTTANKVEIKKAVEAAYGVTVIKFVPKTTVRTQDVTQKPDCNVKTNRTKKAIVDVAEGEAIDFYNNL